MQPIIFTDLDGTLLDFATYSHELTAEPLRDLLDEGTPVIFCSSKTLAEQLAIMESLQVQLPCIVENGSGLYLPPGEPGFTQYRSRIVPTTGGRLINFGISSSTIQSALRSISQRFQVDLAPYSQLSDEELAALTQLTPEAAARARQRDFSETLTAQLPKSVWQEVDRALANVGLRCSHGGRFHTVSFLGCDKGSTLRATLDGIRQARGGEWAAISIGDSANDASMLRAAELAYLVQQPGGTWHPLALPGLQRIKAIGPTGWNLAVQHACRVLA